MNLVLTQLDNAIGTMTLNRPEKHNSISTELADDLIAGLNLMEQAQVRVVIIRAAPGVKVWSAGFDINELPVRRRDPLGYEDALERLLRRVQDFPSPIIAMVEGSVWGGACDLCLSCDLVLCTPESTFAITPAKIGLPYNASGLVHFLNVLGPHKAKEMFFTALPLTAEEAENNHMVNHVVPAAELEARTLYIAQAIARNAPLAVRVLKRQFRLLLSGQVLASETFESIQGMRREVYDSTDYEEGIQAFKEKRPPVFNGV
jgi:methylmalonyl-CoA decarboxylase